nr:hypothetical protein Cry52Nrm3_p011 [Cryptomonas curvata]
MVKLHKTYVALKMLNISERHLIKYYHYKLVDILFVFYKEKKKNVFLFRNFTSFSTKYFSKFYQKTRKLCYSFQENFKKLFNIKNLKIKLNWLFWFGEFMINKNKWSYNQTFIKSYYVIFYKRNHYLYINLLDLIFHSNFDFFSILNIYFVKSIELLLYENFKLSYQIFILNNYDFNKIKLLERKKKIISCKEYSSNTSLYLHVLKVSKKTIYHNIYWFYHLKNILVRNLLFSILINLLFFFIKRGSKYYIMKKKNITKMFNKGENFIQNNSNNWFDLKLKKFKDYFLVKNVVFFNYIHNSIILKQNSYDLLEMIKTIGTLSFLDKTYYDFATFWKYRCKNSIFTCLVKKDTINNYNTIFYEIIEKIKTDALLGIIIKNLRLTLNNNVINIFEKHIKKNKTDDTFPYEHFKLYFFKNIHKNKFAEIYFSQEYDQIINKFQVCEEMEFYKIYFSLFYNSNEIIIFSSLLFTVFIFYKKNLFI